MTDPLVGVQDSFISLYRNMVIPVFRYHLVRSGDWQEAQALTRETFCHAQAWYNPRSVEPKDTGFWLFSIAVWVQLYKRRTAEIADSILPTQEQVALFVRVAEVTQAWNALPLRTADALTLFIFAGLELPEAGEVVNWDLPTIQERLYPYLDNQTDLRLLADELQPVGFFVNHLETELREGQTKIDRGAGPFYWRLAYRFNRTMGWGGRALPLVFFVVLLFWAIWYFSLPLQPNRPPPATATLNPNAQPQDFYSTLDSAILVDQTGAILQYYLTSQEEQPLAPPGFYLPTQQDPAFPPQVSPDGRWLKAVDSTTGRTWLFSFLGEPERMLSKIPVQLAWTRNSGLAYFIDSEHPNQVMVYTVAYNASHPIAIFPGKVLAIAPAPGEDLLAVLYEVPQLAGSEFTTEIALVNTLSRDWSVLIRLQDPSGLQSRHKLTWTEDASEIWYPRYHVALRLNDRKLHQLVSRPPYDPTARPTFLNLLLHPSVAQPFMDRYGLEALLLDDSDPRNNLLNLGVISPDRSMVALGYYNAQGITGTLALQQGPVLEKQSWSDDFPSVGRIAWAKEGHELLVAENENRPGKIYRVIAETGHRLEIAKDSILLGTYAGMAQASKNEAAQMQLVQVAPTVGDPSGTEVIHPGMGVRLTVPAGWRVWRLAEDRAWGSLVVANFELDGPIGFASLGEEQLMVMVSPMAWQDQVPVKDWLDSMVRRAGGRCSYTTETLDGLPAYRLNYKLPDATVETTLVVEAPRGVLGISMVPRDTSLTGIFDQIVSSIRFDTGTTP